MSSSRYERLQQRPPRPLSRPPPSPSFIDFIRFFASRTTLLVLILLVFTLLLILAPAQRRRLQEQELSTFEGLWNRSRTGWREYEPHASRGARDLTTWSDRLSLACAEDLVANGELCEELDGVFTRENPPQVDLLWSWTNGSDLLLQRWKQEYDETLPGRVRPAPGRGRVKSTAYHFRDHDELRFSLRSALAAFSPSSLRQLHLFTTDLPANTLHSDEMRSIPLSNRTVVVNSSRIGAVPTWFTYSSTSSPSLEIIHHSDIFEDPAALPTFNSRSIEASIPSMRSLSEFVLYLNDDMFLLNSGMTAADVGAPILGPVFRIQTDLTVSGVAPGGIVGAADSEWASLRPANHLLDLRFGKRSRGYLAHIPKSLSAPLLREVAAIWHDELLETSFSRFRGKRREYQLAFLATHYVIEAHREALLHSFIVGRSDRDRDGFLSLDERKEMLAELGYEVGDETSIESLVVPFPRRRTRSRLPHLLRRAGIEGPGATTVAFSSMDGFGMGTVAGKTSKQRLRPVLHVDEAGSPIDEHEAEKARLDRGACSMPLARCFGADFLGSKKRFTAVDVFRKLVSGEPTCGDCAIVALVGKSGLNSLSAFLPDCELSSSSSAIDMPPTSLFSLSKSSVSVNFLPSPSPSCSSARAFAIRRILRYSHTLGDSTSRFIGMQNDRTMKMTFEKMRERKERGEIPPTFLTLNDDFRNEFASRNTAPHLRRFFEEEWLHSSPYEKAKEEE